MILIIYVINDLDQTYWMGTAVVQFTLGHFSEMNLIITEVEKCYKLLSTFSYMNVEYYNICLLRCWFANSASGIIREGILPVLFILSETVISKLSPQIMF